MINFLKEASSATAHDAVASTVDEFVMAPNSLNKMLSTNTTSLPDPVDFAKRLSIMLNTVWRIANGPLAFTNSSDTLTNDLLSNIPQEKLIQNVTGSTTVSQDVFDCSTTWIAVLFSCCIIATSMILGYLYWSVQAIGPDILAYVGSLTRHNLYMRIPTGGTTMSGTEISKALPDLTLELVDVEPESEVGHVALSSVGGARLRKNRLYQ